MILTFGEGFILIFTSFGDFTFILPFDCSVRSTHLCPFWQIYVVPTVFINLSLQVGQYLSDAMLYHPPSNIIIAKFRLDTFRTSTYPEPMSKQIKFTALLDEKTYEKLRKASYKHRVSKSGIIRQALANYFQQDNLGKILEKVRKEHGPMRRPIKE